MKKSDFDRELTGPDSYEYFNAISKYCQKMYMGLLKWQLYCLLLIAILSLIPFVPEWPDWADKLRQFIMLLAIAIVLVLMIIQYSKNYMEGWQKARFLAESILSNCWLLIFHFEKYDAGFDLAIEIFHERIREMKEEVNIKSFLGMQNMPNEDNDSPTWLRDNFNKPINERKEFYLKYRIGDQMAWYHKKSSFNRRNSSYYFTGGVIAMFVGMILTVLVLLEWIPNLSYLGLFTTIAASIFSWKQTKRFDELKTTYSVSMDELKDFKKTLLLDKPEEQVKEIVFDTEKAISREHKLWFSRVLE